MSDYYNILNINRTATQKEIKKAYRKLAVIWHPDKNKSPEAESKFKEINEAYDVLHDANKKLKYDRFGKAGINPANQRHSAYQIRKKGPPLKSNIGITFAEMMCGLTKKLEIKRAVKCSKCIGSGLKPACSSHTCTKCKGVGYQIFNIRLNNRTFKKNIPCNGCNSIGVVIKNEDKCSLCKGLQYINIKNIIELKIPEGVPSGKKIIIPNMCDESRKWVVAGDIELRIIVKQQKDLKRVKNDLYRTIPILLVDALTGLDLIINHLDGTKILAQYTEIIDPNKKYRIPEKGFKYNGIRGDMILTFTIIYPKTLEPPVKKLLKQSLPGKSSQPEILSDIIPLNILII
tara:strand:- start:10523 stop:11557 length:1035 start_codon:yes stop_codon:yes gene_type:complete